MPFLSDSTGITLNGMSENLGSTISFDEDMTTVINDMMNY